MTTTRRMPACSRTSQALAHESARNRGGERGAANGLSDLRTAFNVMIAAVGFRGDAAVRALRKSSLDKGEPVMTVRPA